MTVCKDGDTKCVLMFISSLASYFSPPGFPLKAIVHLKIGTVPPLGSRLINCISAHVMFTVHFYHLFGDRAQCKARISLPRSPQLEV